jgi:hypothetical protein
MVVIDGKSVSDRNPIATSFHDSIVVIGSSKMNLDSPDREAIYWHIKSQDIDNPVDQKSGNFIVENPT